MGYQLATRQHVQRVLLQTFILPLTLLLLLVALLLWQVDILYTTSQQVDHADQVIGQANVLLTLLVDMETGVRGYLVTGTDEFLQPYNRANSTLDGQIDTLAQLVRNDPEQLRRVAVLRSDSVLWRQTATAQLALRRQG